MGSLNMAKLLIFTLVFCVALELAAAAPHFTLEDGEELLSSASPIAFEDEDEDLDLDDEPRSELEPLEERDDLADDALYMLNLVPDMRDGAEEITDLPVGLQPTDRGRRS